MNRGPLVLVGVDFSWFHFTILLYIVVLVLFRPIVIIKVYVIGDIHFTQKFYIFSSLLIFSNLSGLSVDLRF